MQAEEFIAWVGDLLKRKPRRAHIEAALRDAGFNRIGGVGCFKVCYQHSDVPQYVVKVFQNPTDWYHDESTTSIRPLEIDEFWLHNIFVCRRYVIQPFANGVGGTPVDAARFFGELFGGMTTHADFDLHFRNIAYHDGAPVIFDYGVDEQFWKPKFRKPRLDIARRYERMPRMVGKRVV